MSRYKTLNGFLWYTKMTNEEILNKKFSRAISGYNIIEVDSFLDDVLKEAEKRDNEKEHLEARVKVLQDEVSWLQARVRSLEDMLK